MSEKDFIKELRNKRANIENLENKYKVISLNFAVKEGAKVPINEAMDYVAHQIEEGAKLIKDRKNLINHGRTRPK